MKYGYARVSTAGQSVQAQVEKLTKEGCDVVYQETFTATKMERPQFKALLSTLEPSDTLVVTKLDRFARTTKEALVVLQDLFEKGVRVHVLNMGIIEDTSTGRLLFTVLTAFAQFERDMIVERTQEGKQIARMNPGFREGRPFKHSNKQLEHALKLKETHSYAQVEELTGISKSTLIRGKKRLEKPL